MAQLKSTVIDGKLQVTGRISSVIGAFSRLILFDAASLGNNNTRTSGTNGQIVVSQNGQACWQTAYFPTTAGASGQYLSSDGTSPIWVNFPTTMTPSSHAHGNITNAGKIGSGNNLVVTSSGTISAGATISSTVSSQSQSTKFLREDGQWATPSYTTNTNTDTLVRQTVYSDNVSHKLLFTTAASPAATADEAGYSTNIDINPSTMLMTFTKANHTGDQGLIVNNTDSTNTLKVGYIVGNSGNGGIYDYTHSKWVLKTAPGSTYSATFDGLATKATGDSDGNAINTTYIKKSVLSGAFDLMYSSAANTPTRLAANTTNTQKFLAMTGTGSAGAAPVWSTLPAATTGTAGIAKLGATGGAATYEHTHTYLVFDSTATNTTNREVSQAPADYNGKLIFCGIKKSVAALNISGVGTYSQIIGFNGWSDMSGGGAHELAFSSDGIRWRTGNTTNGWGAWSHLGEEIEIIRFG